LYSAFPMIAHRILVVTAAAALAACAQLPGEQPERGDAKPAPRVIVAKPQSRTAPLPRVELSSELMFKMMLAEIAVQRGQTHIGVTAYLELARQTLDPRIAQRATEIAWGARLISAAIEAAGIWLQADPGSAQARQVIAALLVNQAQLAEAQPHLERWLQADGDNVGQSFLQLNVLLARHQDKPAVLKLIQALARPYANVPEARFAVAQAAWNADAQEIALAEVRAALKLRPDWENAVLFQVQVLANRGVEEALRYLAEYVAGNPMAREVRLTYARMLVTAKQYGEARKQFESLVGDFPQNADVGMAVALLAMQTSDYEAAEKQLKRVLELNYKDPDVARYYLGQVNEERKRFDEALKWYSSIGQGEQYINAQTRYAGVLAKQGRLADARKHLQEASAQNNQQRVQLTQAEAHLLREASAYREAFDLLGRALDKLPQNPELLYDHALAAEKVDRIDVLESNLRRLIEIRPDHAHAYNALGYTFADRNVRIEEAYNLIDTALKLAPDDPFIMDSMGWVLYRMGRTQDGLAYLRRAFELRPDPEIAAHLGEVLWVLGQRDEAKKIWAEAIKDHPKNEALQATVKRFLP
jgi:tetratricopeptide (TPR) repeat protein